MKPRVSIVTTILNQSDYLRKNIASIRASTMTSWEHIIVDDGSTEDIQAVIKECGDARIRYHRFEKNRGFQHGINQGLDMCQGEYVGILSADEIIWDKKLQVQVGWMDSHPLIGATWGMPTPNTGKKWMLGPVEPWEQFQWKAHNRSRESWIRTLLRLESIPIGGASMLMRKECVERIGGFDPQFHDVSDLEWFVRFFQRYQGWILPYRLADAEHPETRLSAPNEARFSDNLKRLHEKHKLVMPPTSGKVTVAMPVRNMMNTVGTAMASVLNQTYGDLELIVLDDASEDGTAHEIQKFTDPRVKFLQFDENRGVAQAQNQMLAAASTEFFMLLAADDVLDHTFIERCLAEFKRDPYLEMVACQTDFIDIDGRPVTQHPFLSIPRPTNKPREEWLKQLYYGNHYFGAALYRTQALIDVGGWDDTVGVIADLDVYLKLLQRENIHVIEENLIHTRVHDGQRSQLKGREAMLKLRQDYHTLRVRYYPPRMKVIIATPFYEMRGFSPYIASTVATIQILCKYGIEHEWWELSGDSYVDRAKNTLFNRFLEDPDATHIFMIDSDMQWDPHSFINMVMLPEDIVMGSYPQKNSWETWTARPLLLPVEGTTDRFQPVGRQLPDGSALIKAEYLAGGYIRIRRAALEKYKEKFGDLCYMDPGADPSAPDRMYTEFFTCVREKNEQGVPLRWGEDRIFGRRMQEIGVEGWIYPNVHVGHYGVKGWTGNYDTYLRQQLVPVEATTQ